MRASFCPYCGLKLIKKEIGDEGLVPFCPECNKPLFDHMIPCVIIVCYTTDNKIVLAHEPNSPLPYVLIAGYTKIGENLEEAVKREVMEELGVEVTDISYLSSYFQKSRENLMVGFSAKINQEPAKISKELESIKLVDYKEAQILLKEAKIASKVLNDYIKNGQLELI